MTWKLFFYGKFSGLNVDNQLEKTTQDEMQATIVDIRPKVPYRKSDGREDG